MALPRIDIRKTYLRIAMHASKAIAALKPSTDRPVRRKPQAGGALRELTPDRVKSVMTAAAGGDPAEQDVVFNEMLERDGHLTSVYNTRLQALTGLDWEILPANQVGQDGEDKSDLPEEVADYCRATLSGIESFEDALEHLAENVGRGVAVAELVWEVKDGGLTLIDVVPVDFSDLLENDAGQLCIATEASPQGEPLESFGVGKFIIARPRGKGRNNPFRGGLLRVAIIGHMFKHNAFKFWNIGLELFGMPTRVSRYPKGASDEEKQAMLQMLEDMGASGYGIFQAGAEVDLVESMKQSAQWPHELLIKYIDAAHSKLMVGQTLTTEIGSTGGSNAAAQTHDLVRKDLLKSDIKAEATAIRQYLLRPLAQAKFGPYAPAPRFRRVLEEPKDLKAQGELISLAVNDLGEDVPRSFIQAELGIPLVADPADPDFEKPIRGRRQAATPFDATTVETNRTRALQVIAHSEMQQVVTHARRSPMAGTMAAWVAAAVLASMAHTSNVMASISSFIDKRRTNAEALADLPEVFDSLPIDDMVTLQHQFLLAGQLAGQVEGRANVRRKRERVATHAAINFAAIPFVEAIDNLRDRLGLTPEEFIELDSAARSRAFRIAGVYNMQLLSDVHGELVKSIAAGETERDFRLRVRDKMAGQKGWAGGNPWHASIVHSQNFAMATAAGNFKQYRELGIERWTLVAGSDKPCEICAPAVGKYYAMNDRRFWAPLHFKCYCTSEPVFEDEPGIVVSSERVLAPEFAAQQAKPNGFKWDPAHYGRLEPLNLSNYPADLQPKFEAHGKKAGWEIIK